MPSLEEMATFNQNHTFVGSVETREHTMFTASFSFASLESLYGGICAESEGDNYLVLKGTIAGGGSARTMLMPDSKADPGDKAVAQHPEQPVLNTSEGQKARLASAQQVEAIRLANPNVSDGSVQNWALKNSGAAQNAHETLETSLKLIHTDSTGQQRVIAERKVDGSRSSVAQGLNEPILLASTDDLSAAATDAVATRAIFPGTVLPEPWMINLSGECIATLSTIAKDLTPEQWSKLSEAMKKAVVNPFEHPYRGHELDTLALVPVGNWKAAYEAFPDIANVGGLTAHDTERLMKVIVANELTFYGPEDKVQDILVGMGLGSSIADKSIGFAQIITVGIKNLSTELDKQVTEGHLKVNPLKKFAAMENSELAKELLKPENVPLFVAAHINHNVLMLKNHSSEVRMALESLGYQFNADMRYTIGVKQLITKNEAGKKHIESVSALPSDEVLRKSAHAKNIREWLAKIL